jgi:GDPmannose 4,6-dehydratase
MMSFSQVNLEWKKYVTIDKKYLRPTEVESLIGDYSKAYTELGWAPKTLTPDLARKIIEFTLTKISRESKP